MPGAGLEFLFHDVGQVTYLSDCPAEFVFIAPEPFAPITDFVILAQADEAAIGLATMVKVGESRD